MRGVNKLISVFVCGVQKGGTTSLYAHFREHPALSPPSQKELHFFDDECRNWDRPGYADILAYFPADDGDRLRFDITPIYCFWPPALARIRDYNPQAKLIYLFRDPFERAWSQWCMEFARNAETLPFAEAIREGRKRMQGLAPLADERRVYTYVERGFYGEQVRRALAHFSRGQLLFLRSRDFWNDHVRTLARISEFLGIPPFPDTGPKWEFRQAEGPFPSEPTEADRVLISELTRPDIREFAALTGLNVADWPTMRSPDVGRATAKRWALAWQVRWAGARSRFSFSREQPRRP